MVKARFVFRATGPAFSPEAAELGAGVSFSMKVQVEVLRAALNQLLDHAKEMQGDAIEVDADLYWFVPKEALNDPANVPAGLTLGSLDDDWSEVSAIGTGAKEPFGYGLVWASAVLRAIGDRTS